MAGIDWSKALDIERAVRNLRVEMVGDWHQDPWSWPELGFLLKKQPEIVYARAAAADTLEPSLIDVPKENWSTRPAVVLDTTDRLTYQALVDRASVQLVGNLSANAFGWRLPANDAKPGTYSHNNKQWDGYRRHLTLLANWYEVALRTDIVSFFANVPIEPLQEMMVDRCGSSAVVKRLCTMVAGFASVPERPGLPQRSTASAVLANMFLMPLDDLLLHHAKPIPRLLASKVTYHSFARWMDDMWLFGTDPAAARRAQMELEAGAQSLGLNLNYGKTDVLEGDEVTSEALEVEHSAVDGGLAIDNSQPLENLIDRILTKPELASRTSIKFASQRMRENDLSYRLNDLLLAANRMPHAADALSRLFKEFFAQSDLRDWFLDYAASDWATHEWCIAQYGRMFPSSHSPRKQLREFFAEAISDANTTLPLLAIAAQRLSAWDNAEARAIFRESFRYAASPHARRVIALAALGAGETRSKVRSWLSADKENEPTRAMLDEFGYRGPRVQADFAK